MLRMLLILLAAMAVIIAIVLVTPDRPGPACEGSGGVIQGGVCVLPIGGR